MISVEEQLFWRPGCIVRPFSESAGVKNRGYSCPLQRAIVDFGADKAFAQVPQKLKEHYGITVPVSAARQITLEHGEQMEAICEPETAWPEDAGVAMIVGETDGCMLPIVTIPPSQAGDPEDGRRRRQVEWTEARLSLAYEQGRAQPFFAATLGSVEEVGDGLLGCAIRAGLGQQTTVHCIADGARWIAHQVERVFGVQGTFLVDFYHLCEYLAAAAPCCAAEDPDAWLKTQKQRLKTNQVAEVLTSLEPFREPETVPDKDAPVRRAWRYLHNRPGQFRYQDALEADLPISSAEVESAHRYVPQARLKIPGAWWKQDNTQRMLNLRVVRANGDWDGYWGQKHREAA